MEEIKKGRPKKLNSSKKEYNQKYYQLNKSFYLFIYLYSTFLFYLINVYNK